MLKTGDTLVLTIPTPHGGDLGIWNPKGEFFFLVFPPDMPAEFIPVEASHPLVPWGKFKTMDRLSIPIDTLKWVPRPERNGPLRLIFDEPGDYEVQMGVYQEAEKPPPRFRCRVHFVGRAS